MINKVVAGLVINKVIATVDIDGNVLTMRLAE